LDFARARRDPTVTLFPLDKIENTSLSIGQHFVLSSRAICAMQVQMNR
jgi:hypothetical protein